MRRYGILAAIALLTMTLFATTAYAQAVTGGGEVHRGIGSGGPIGSVRMDGRDPVGGTVAFGNDPFG